MTGIRFAPRLIPSKVGPYTGMGRPIAKAKLAAAQRESNAWAAHLRQRHGVVAIGPERSVVYACGRLASLYPTSEWIGAGIASGSLLALGMPGAGFELVRVLNEREGSFGSRCFEVEIVGEADPICRV